MERIVGKVGVLDKVSALLDALEDGPLALADLPAATGLPRATAYRLATALEEHGLIRRDGDGRFALGLRLIGLGRAAAEGFPLGEAARPVLTGLRDATGESVQLYVRSGAGRLAAVSLQSSHGLRWIVPEGAVLPMDRGSAGKVLREGGTAESVEEREAGVASVSTAVCDRSGAVVAAVSVSGPVGRLTRSPRRRFGPAVEAAARAVEVAAALR